jgi:hypothetical protein
MSMPAAGEDAAHDPRAASDLATTRAKVVAALAASAIYVLLLLASYVAYMWLLPVDVVFYASLAAAAVATLVAASLLFRPGAFRALSRFERGQLLAIWLLAGYSMAISIPTLIDRSLSFYILEKLDQRGGGIRLDRFENIFTSEYLREHRLVDVRLTEQLASGTIRIERNCVLLTPRGERLARFGQFFRRHLLPKQRLLMGEYTDALTDPFRRSEPAPDYLCSESAP